MSTHSIGTGTANLSINIPADERAVWGRLAFKSGDRGLGEFVRRVALAGLEQADPEAAAQVKEIRRRYYGASMLAVFVATLAFGDHIDLRRSRSGLRVRVEEVREGEA